MVPTLIKLHPFHAFVVLLGTTAAAAHGQTRSLRGTTNAYGARLDVRGQPQNLNTNRLNNRIDNRVSNRLAVRLERYRTNNPVAAYQAPQNDRSRAVPVIAPPPPEND